MLDRVECLAPGRAVLHPPKGSPDLCRYLLAAFIDAWRRRSSVPLLIENTPWSDVLSLGEDFLFERGAAFCLDVAHAMGYGQIRLLQSSLPARAAMIHWSAPGAGDAHAALDAWTPEQLRAARALAVRLPGAATHVLEMFSWQRIEASLPLLENLIAGASATPRLAAHATRA